MSETVTLPIYNVARDCGHWTRVTRNPPSGIEWCELCGEYRGVIVLRIEPNP